MGKITSDDARLIEPKTYEEIMGHSFKMGLEVYRQVSDADLQQVVRQGAVVTRRDEMMAKLREMGLDVG